MKNGSPRAASNNVRQFESYLQSKGAIPAQNAALPSPSPWEIKYAIETKAGPLYISVHRSDFTKSGQLKARQMASIFCCFKDTERAASCPEVDKNRLNHYSGKYNYHVQKSEGDSRTPWEYCFSLFNYELKRIL